MTRHALRNAVISTVVILGVNIGFLVGGTIVIEKVFALPGIGALMIDSIFNRDFAVVQGVTLFYAPARDPRLPGDRPDPRDTRPACEAHLMATAEVIAAPAEIAERRTFRHRWYRTPTFVAGLLILGTLAVLVAFAPLHHVVGPGRAGPAQHPRSPRRRSTCSAPTTSGATSGRACSTAAGSTSRSASSRC